MREEVAVEVVLPSFVQRDGAELLKSWYECQLESKEQYILCSFWGFEKIRQDQRHVMLVHEKPPEE